MTAKDLKNALLQEAVQGKLVPQIASEGNARDLLEEIRKERLSHGFANSYGICGEKGKKSKSSDLRSKSQISVTTKELPDITEDEIPFEIPESWCWCRIKDIAYVSTGMTPLKSESKFYENGNIPWVTSTLTSSDYIDKADTYITEFALKNTSLDLYPKHTLILAMYGQGKTRGQISELLIPATINQACAAIELYSSNEALRKYMKLFHSWNYNNLRKEAAGSAQPNLNLNIIQNTLIPLPPLAEQKRIVAAIENFMPLIEEYGKKETELKAINEKIGTLTKKAILQEAVQGKLVPQIAAEGNAKDLLEEIKKEKAKLIKEGKIKKEKPLPEISDDEIPFDIPENWCWCRLGEIMYIWSARRVHQSDWKNQGIPFYRAREIGKLADFGYVDNELFISEELYNEYVKTGIPEENDLMITAVGTLGKAYIVKKDDHFYYKDASVISFKNFGRLNSSYLKIIMDSVFMQEQIKNTSSGTTVGTITIQNANHFLIPLPPLAEQKRIVAAIEKMLSLCEKIGG